MTRELVNSENLLSECTMGSDEGFCRPKRYHQLLHSSSQGGQVIRVSSFVNYF